MLSHAPKPLHTADTHKRMHTTLFVTPLTALDTASAPHALPWRHHPQLYALFFRALKHASSDCPVTAHLRVHCNDYDERAGHAHEVALVTTAFVAFSQCWKCELSCWIPGHSYEPGGVGQKEGVAEDMCSRGSSELRAGQGRRWRSRLSAVIHVRCVHRR